jgi:hypothetical protein
MSIHLLHLRRIEDAAHMHSQTEDQAVNVTSEALSEIEELSDERRQKVTAAIKGIYLRHGFDADRLLAKAELLNAEVNN